MIKNYTLKNLEGFLDYMTYELFGEVFDKNIKIDNIKTISGKRNVNVYWTVFDINNSLVLLKKDYSHNEFSRGYSKRNLKIIKNGNLAGTENKIKKNFTLTEIKND